MAVNLTDMDIGTRYALQEDFNNGFVGRDRQVVIQTDDPKGYRPVIMDGVTQGGKNKVALVNDLSDYVPVDTYNSEKAGFATKSELSGYETTTHASATYATKTELAGKADSATLASYAPLANPAFTGTATLGGQTIATVNQIPDVSGFATKAELSAKADASSVPILTSSTTDLEAGTSPLATGTYYFVYE